MDGIEKFIVAAGKRIWFRQETTVRLMTREERQALAIAEAFTTLRAVYYATREHMPVIAKGAAESAASLVEYFPALAALEAMIRIGEEEFANQPGGNNERKEGPKPS
jgi:hypothetical protein